MSILYWVLLFVLFVVLYVISMLGISVLITYFYPDDLLYQISVGEETSPIGCIIHSGAFLLSGGVCFTLGYFIGLI